MPAAKKVSAKKVTARKRTGQRVEADLTKLQDGANLWVYRNGHLGVGLPPDFGHYVRAYRITKEQAQALHPDRIAHNVSGRVLVIESPFFDFQLAVRREGDTCEVWLKEGSEEAVLLETYHLVRR